MTSTRGRLVDQIYKDNCVIVLHPNSLKLSLKREKMTAQKLLLNIMRDGMVLDFYHTMNFKSVEGPDLPSEIFFKVW